LTIAADDVDIDFRGHRIRFTSAGTGFDIAGNGVSIHDGTLDSDLESTAIVAHGVDLTIHDMSIYSYQGLSLGERVVVRNSSLRGRFVLINGGDDVLVENSEMSCAFSCVQIGNRGTLRGNTIDGFGDYVVIAKGDDNTIESNLIDANGPDAFVIDVRGNHNLIARNTVREPDGNLGILIRIGGTANVVDSTIVLPPGPDFPPANVGIQFLRDGNYYGNNRIGTLVPFDLGGTTQTDWGGNVGY
jgi:hypothetical protein